MTPADVRVIYRYGKFERKKGATLSCISFMGAVTLSHRSLNTLPSTPHLSSLGQRFGPTPILSRCMSLP